MSVERADTVTILKCILDLDPSHHNARSVLKVSAIIIISSNYSQLFRVFCFCFLVLAYAAVTPVQFLFGSYTRFISWFEK